MKRLVLFLIVTSCVSNVFPQNNGDSLELLFKEFRLSVEVGYNFLFPSSTETDDYYIPSSTVVHHLFNSHYIVENPWKDTTYDHYGHHQWNVSVAAEGKKVKWKLGLSRDYLHYMRYKSEYDADYIKMALSMQFYLLKKERIILLLGPSIEMGWITNYIYSTNSVTIYNPNICRTTGINLLFPLTVLFPITENSRLFLNVASGLHLRDDHSLPTHDHWGYGPGPEAGLRSYCPLSIGIGYSIMLL